MNKKLKELLEKLEAAKNALKAITAKGADATEEEITAGEALAEEMKTLGGEIEKVRAAIKGMEVLSQTAADAESYLNTPVKSAFSFPGAVEKEENPETNILSYTGMKDFKVPATAYRSKSTVFKTDLGGRTAEQKAFAMGMFAIAVLTDNAGAKSWCEKNGPGLQLAQKATPSQVEGINTLGGFLVWPELDRDIIDLKEIYGVARRLARIVPMHSDTKQRPRRASGLTAYFVGEIDAITPSTKGWDAVQLVAKDLAALTYISNDLNEDAIIDVGDDIAREMAYAFAIKEDQCFFLGDGTSTYGGMVGIVNRFKNQVADAGGTWTTDANKLYHPNVRYVTGATWASITLADLSAFKSTLPEFARMNAKWVMNRAFYDSVIEKLLLAAGGITDAMISAGVQPRLLGYPVEIAQILPSAEAVDDIVAFFGDFKLSTDFGDRRQTTIDTSKDFAFNTRQIAVRGVERFDIVHHDTGVASATAGSRVAGPVSALAIKHS